MIYNFYLVVLKKRKREEKKVREKEEEGKREKEREGFLLEIINDIAVFDIITIHYTLY